MKDENANPVPRRWIFAIVVALLACGVVALVVGRDGGGQATTDPVSGLVWVEIEQLPAEAASTLALVDDGGPFPYDRDGATFMNREGHLPGRRRGYYTEYTVPTPGASDRGARRLVLGGADEYYYTSDHYRSFQRIRR